jgi:phosphate uptake regulator
MADKTGNKSIEKENLTRRITFRLPESEYAQISDELAVCGLSLSAFARKRLLGQRVTSKADLAVLGELRRLGGLLKHIHNETRGAYSNLTAQAIKDLSAYVRTLSTKQRSAPNDTEAHQ